MSSRFEDSESLLQQLINEKCRWCGCSKLHNGHEEDCLSFDVYPPNHVHEIWPGIHLGVVEARTDGRYAAVLGILSSANMKWVGPHVRMPESPYHLVEHEDRNPMLIRKLASGWDLIDRYAKEGPVLFHCHQGASRSAAALAGYMVDRRGMSLYEALEKIFFTRPATAHFWPGWIPELVHLERQVRLRSNKDKRK